MLTNLAPWLFLLVGILAFAITMGMLLNYFRQVRNALLQSEERFRAISTYTYDWEIWLGTDGKPLWINTTANRMTGISNEEALAMPDYPLSLVAEKDREAVRAALALVAQGGIIDDQLFQMRRPDNSILWASLSGQQVFTANGTLLGSRLSIRDVSTLIDYQETIDRKKQLLQSVLDNTNDGIIVLNEDFRVIFFNTRYLKLWGLSRTFLNEQPTMQDVIKEVCGNGLYSEEEAETLSKRRIEDLIRGGDKIVLETPRQDGMILESFANPLPGIGYLLTYRDVTAQILANRETQRSREHYRTLIETVPHGIIECDLSGRILYANASFGASVGMATKQLQECFFWDALSTPEAAGMMKMRFEEIRDEGHQPGTELVRTINSAGGFFWHQVDWNFLLNERGEPTGYIAVVTDITERKMAEQKEREQSAFIQTILDSIPAPIFYKDATCRYLGCNTAFEKYLGHSRDQIIDKNVFDIAPPDLAQIYHDADMELLRQGGTQSYETQVLFADGKRHDILFSKAVFPEHGGLVGTMLDISDRKSAEREARENEKRYKTLFHEFETIFNGIPDSLTVWSSEMRLVWANSSSAAHFGVPVGELTGKGCQDLCAINFEHDPCCEIHRCFTSQNIEEAIRKTRDNRTWGVKVFPLRNSAGSIDRVIRLASDLTERIVLREETARAAHLAALGELAAGMAHEINNPTSLILLEMPILQEVFRDISEILEEHSRVHGDFFCGGLRYSKMRKELPEMIAEILNGAERIKHIVEELRDFSHPTESNQFQTIDLNNVVRKALHLVSTQVKKTTDHFSVSYASPPPKCLGSLQRLEQVVINLVLNACQALPDRERSLTITVGSWPEHRRNFIRVSDTGIGILPEHIKLITDPFFTTRRAVGGTGLGLSVSTRIIEEHGGSLHFASKPGEGTTVTIELPMVTEKEFI